MMLRAFNKKGKQVLEMKDDGKIKVTEEKLKKEIIESGKADLIEEDKKEDKGDE